MHLYETYADNCVKMGNSQEGIQTLQSLVRRYPGHVSGWRRLASLLLETGQVQHAVTTMQGTVEYFTPMPNKCPRGESHHQLEGMFKKVRPARPQPFWRAERTLST